MLQVQVICNVSGCDASTMSSTISKCIPFLLPSAVHIILLWVICYRSKKIHSTNALLVSSPSKNYTQYSASTISLLPCSQWLLSHAISPIEMYFFCLHLFMFHFCWRILSFFMLMLHFLSEFFDLILCFFCVSNRFSSPNGSFVSSICFFFPVYLIFISNLSIGVTFLWLFSFVLFFALRCFLNYGCSLVTLVLLSVF